MVIRFEGLDAATKAAVLKADRRLGCRSLARAKPKLVEPGFTCERKSENRLEAKWSIALHLEPTTNGGGIKKWLVGIAAKHRRTVANAFAPRLHTLACFYDSMALGRPLKCTITRLGGRAMDCDNLPPVAKWVRDTVALFLGVDDGPRGPIHWAYDQEPGGECGVRIELQIL